MRKTLYWDTIFSGLVPVRYIEEVLRDLFGIPVIRTVLVEVTADHGPYRAGERLQVHAHDVVQVTRQSTCYTYVRSALNEVGSTASGT
jgi:hypothetical protein